MTSHSDPGFNFPEVESIHFSGAVPRRPFTLVRAQGARLWTDDGREFIDCAAAHGWANVGHSHPAVTAAIQQQAATFVATHEGAFNDQRARWMAELAAALPGDISRIQPANSGAEAVEAALKAARFFTGRTEIIAAKRGFHGRTFGALSATWQKKYRAPFEPLVPDFRHVTFNDLDAMDAAISDKTAAVILEVVQGEGGVYPGNPDYFAGVRRLCDERGALLIFDEIQTGMGRTGKLFATEHLPILPDMMTLGKGLGGGIPMGAAVWRESLGKLDAGIHGSTFAGNPLACAASRAVLRVMRDEQLPARAARLGDRLMAALRAIDAPQIREVRGLGLMVGVQLRGRVTPVLKALADEGIWALPAGPTVLRLLPPLVISEEDLQTVVEKVAQCVKT